VLTHRAAGRRGYKLGGFAGSRAAGDARAPPRGPSLPGGAQIGGLAVATVITLLLVPVFYAITVKDLKLVRWEA
jgi:hypothetical protein